MSRKFSIKAARQDFQDEKHASAVANYLAVLKLQPHRLAALRSEFFQSLLAFTSELERKGKSDEANEYFTLAHDLYPNSPDLYNIWGQFLFNCGLEEEAATCFLKALRLEPCHENARQNFQNLSSHLIDQWHMRMLNDVHRNSKYEEALSSWLKKENSVPQIVLDIGSGSGILSMLAVESGALRVIGCEQSEVVCSVAREIIKDNKMDKSILLINKRSQELSVGPHQDLPVKATLVVSEIMDAGFYGEGIVSALVDARNRLLADDGIVIPNAARLYAVVIESDYIRMENVVNSSKEGQKPILITEYCAETLEETEPYISHHLAELRDVKFLSDPICIDHICFNDNASLMSHFEGFEKHVEIPISSAGRCDGFAMWFEVELAPEVRFCTDMQTQTAWEQAVFPIASNIRVFPQQVTRVLIKLKKDRLKLVLTAVNGNSVVSQADQATITTPGCILRISDNLCLQYYADAIKCCYPTGPCAKNRLLDLSHNPAVSVLLRKTGGQAVTVFKETLEEIILRTFINDIENNLDSQNDSNNMLISSEELQNFAYNSTAFDVVVCDVIDSTGLLRSGALEDLLHHRIQFGIINVIPSCVLVYGAVIECHEVFARASVTSDTSVLGLKIKDKINVFRSPIQQDTRIDVMEHKYLSEPTVLMTLHLDEPLDVDSQQMPSFLEKSETVGIEINKAGHAHGLLVWYEYYQDSAVRISSLNCATNFKQCIFICDDSFVNLCDHMIFDLDLVRGDLRMSKFHKLS